MYKIGLINMPFSSIQLPSIALTQLKFVLRSKLVDRALPEIYYLNHDFAQHLGLKHYWQIANSLKSTVSGLGDWFFRQVAFPEAPDNTEDYYARFIWQFEQREELAQFLNEKRQGLDAFFDQMIDQYELETCSLIGFTSLFTQNMAAFAMARKLKIRNPNIVTVIGGANCEASMGEVICRNVPAIDYVFSGPALKTFPDLVNFLIEGEKEKCDEIVGVISTKKLNRTITGRLNEIGAELDINEVVPLNYDDFLQSIDQKCPSEAANVGLLFQTSRGCWWGERSQCRFCGLNGSQLQYRFMEPQKALQQFDELFKYAPRVLHYKAVDNIMPKPYFSEVLPFLQTPENAQIFYEIKTNLDDRQIESLANAGVTAIQPGIEALNTSTLKIMRKGTTAFQNIKFLKSCLTHSIKADWNLLIGFPGEGEEVFEKYNTDLPLLVHLPPPTGVFPIRFDRFSPYFRDADEFGLQLKPYDFYQMVYPFKEQELYDLAYFFMDHNYSAPHMKLSAKWIKKLEKHVDRWRCSWSEGMAYERPRLEFEWRGESQVLFDSRSGVATEHQIGAAGSTILDLLTEPMKLPQMIQQLESMPEPEVKSQIDWLLGKGLIFEEKDRYISLVVDSGQDLGYL